MDKIQFSFKAVIGGVIAFFTHIFGGVDILLKVLLICVVFDYITGIMAAIYTKTLNSETGFKGIIKKVAILMIVALSYWVGQATGAEAVRTLVISFYIANEGISMLENAGRMDIPVLDKFQDILEQLKDKK